MAFVSGAAIRSPWLAMSEGAGGAETKAVAAARRLHGLCDVGLRTADAAIRVRLVSIGALGSSGNFGCGRDVLLDAVALIATPIRISYLWRPVLSDAGDDLLLETAVNGRADVVVTFNRRDFEPVAGRFGFEVIVPSDSARRLENRK
jgi:hypothetical protein